MPLGPLAQLDDIGIDVILRAAAGMQRGKSGIPATSGPLLALYQAGRLGRKSGAGFFQYETADAEPQYDPNAAAVIGATHSTSAGRAAGELTLHLFLPMLAAAADLLARSVVKSIGDVRMALRDGLGFDPARHDLIKWAAGLPVSQLESWLERLSLGSHLMYVRRLLRP
jgi:3-hydroxyacyl-CoA dehydrogenase